MAQTRTELRKSAEQVYVLARKIIAAGDDTPGDNDGHTDDLISITLDKETMDMSIELTGEHQNNPVFLYTAGVYARFRPGFWVIHLQNLAEEAIKKIREHTEYTDSFGPAYDDRMFDDIKKRSAAITNAAIRLVRLCGERSGEESRQEWNGRDEETLFSVFTDHPRMKIWHKPKTDSVEIGLDITADGSCRYVAFAAYDGRLRPPQTFIYGDWEKYLIELALNTN